MHSRQTLCTLTAALFLVPAPSGAQALVGRSDSIYTWRGAVPAGALLSIRNFNGPIEVRSADGASAELRAEKRASRGSGSIEDVAFVVEKGSGGDVSICASMRNTSSCGERGDGYDGDDRGGWRRNVTVAMTVRLPRGARLKVATGNGIVTVQGVGGDVQASTGNGAVRIDDTEGAVRVSTGNGDVDVRGARSAVRVTS